METKGGFTRRSIMTILMCGLAVSLAAQDIVVVDRYDELYGSKRAVYMSVRGDMNADDGAIGAAIGMINKKRNLAFFSVFDARPFRKNILEYIGNNTYYQYQQERFYIGGGLEYKRAFDNAPFGAFAQINTLYTWGKYGGTLRKPEKGWMLIPRMGVYWQLWEAHSLSFGYAYADPKDANIETHRLYISFNSIFSKRR